jgi:high-affinity Fe2+/Pb2+ permease
LCLACLTKRSQPATGRGAEWERVGWAAGAVVGGLLAWLFFLGLGEWIWRATA